MAALTTVLVLFIVTHAANALLLDRSWTYQEMFDKADLVVIATASSTKDTGERTTSTLKVKVKGMETEFFTALTLKGPKEVKNFRLHHYQVESEDDSVEQFALLLWIPPGTHPTFLLFLIKEKDGRYAPVTGQTDPAIFSVLKLNGGADPAVWFKPQEEH